LWRDEQDSNGPKHFLGYSLCHGVMTPSANESSEMKQNTNNVTYVYLKLSLYVTPYVKMPSVARDIFDMYDTYNNLGEQ
jgi:hypothetical protein